MACQTPGHIRPGEAVRRGDVPGLCQGLPHQDPHGQIPQRLRPPRHLEGYVPCRLPILPFPPSILVKHVKMVHLYATFLFSTPNMLLLFTTCRRWQREGTRCVLPQGGGVHEGVRGVGRRQADPLLHVHRRLRRGLHPHASLRLRHPPQPR